MDIERIGLIGLGAVGSVYAKQFLKAYGENFYILANSQRADYIMKKGVKVNGSLIYPNIISTEVKNDECDIDLLLVCVKNYQLEDCFDEIRNVINDNTIILPLLNGITATNRLKEAFPNNVVLYGAVYILAEKICENVYSNNKGLIRFGEQINNDDNYSDSVLRVKQAFEEAKIDFEIPYDMISTLWRKWLINIGSNQVSAIVGAGYNHFKEVEEIQILICNAMLEVVEVAESLGVNLPKEDVEKYVANIFDINYDYDYTTSTLQDIRNGRKTEIEYFAGDLIKIAKRASVNVPVNETLYYLIKAIEKIN